MFGNISLYSRETSLNEPAKLIKPCKIGIPESSKKPGKLYNFRESSTHNNCYKIFCRSSEMRKKK